MSGVKGDNVTSELLLAMKSGKYVAGFKSTLESVINRQAKCLVISSNFPATKKKQLEYYSVLAGGLPIIFHTANNNELGSITERGHRLGCISILDQGEADLIPAKED
ncbi:putative ribosomal protein [Ordospora pajunii]|jgi:large subunit ribosomal protein L30e|uniref:putative ribosomal protein n=1 Tax=Ordospora pajunii TaxID=3039483 RepID=UPI0029527D63|nr:putative ribosomal protein [Ordospora pajunii]KAH9411335.1 putative ribosomal protein [Ordospora pajunii]